MDDLYRLLDEHTAWFKPFFPRVMAHRKGRRRHGIRSSLGLLIQAE